jgi:hypothetical protein
LRVLGNTEASRLIEQHLAAEEGFCCKELVNYETVILSFVALSNILCSLVTENSVLLL